jgi:hypothetical protein
LVIGAAVDVMSKARSRDWTERSRSCRCAKAFSSSRQFGRGAMSATPHDYIRHGTTGLFAALEVATGKVTADSWWRDVRHGERAKRVADPFTDE